MSHDACVHLLLKVLPLCLPDVPEQSRVQAAVLALLQVWVGLRACEELRPGRVSDPHDVRGPGVSGALATIGTLLSLFDLPDQRPIKLAIDDLRVRVMMKCPRVTPTDVGVPGVTSLLHLHEAHCVVVGHGERGRGLLLSLKVIVDTPQVA